VTGDASNRSRRLLDDPSARVHHFGLLERWLLPGILFGFFGWGAAELIRSGDSADFALAVGMVVVSGGIWALAIRVVFAYNDQEVLVRNVRTRIVPRHDIVSATPTYEGLVLRTSAGRRLTALAVQEYNVALILGRRTRAARVAEEVLIV